MEIIVKSQETRSGVQFRIIKNGKYLFANIKFMNYFYIKTSDYQLHKDDFYNIFTFCIEKTEHIGQFTKIILSNNFMRYRVKTFWDERCQTYEADIKANKRYLLDHDLKLNNEKIPYTFYDIETDDRIPLKNDERGLVVVNENARILSFSGVDYKGEKFSLLLKSETDEDERMLLTKIIEYFSNYGIISGWFSERFDMPYIKQRCDTLGVNYTILDYINHLDYKELFIKYDRKSRDSYSLNAISNEVLHEGKLDQKKGEGAIYNTYKENPDYLLKYNIEDSNLIYKMNLILMFIEVSMHIVNLTKCHVRSAMHNSDSGDYLLMREYTNANVIMVSKPTKEQLEIRKQEARISGGFTRCLIPGYHEKVEVFDFKSYYPWTIATFNIDPMTFVEKLGMETKESDFPDYIVTPSNFNEERQSFHPRRLYKKEMGVIPKVCLKLVAERDKIKYSMKQYKESDPDKYKQMYLHQYCFHPKTQILTCNGIKYLKDVKLGEQVYSINPKTLNIELKPVTDIYTRNYKGRMFHYKNKLFKLRTTDSHEYLVSQNFKNLQKIQAKEFDNHRYEIPLHNKMKLKEGDKLLSYLIGWYISEGYSNNTQCVICQSFSANPIYYTEIKNLLILLNIKFGETKKRDRFYLRDAKIKKFLSQFGINSHSKKLYTDWVYQYGNEEAIQNTLYKGDGSKYHKKYSTVSKQLAEDYLQLMYRLGYRATISRRKTKSKCYLIRHSTIKRWKIRRKNYQWEYYEGKVHNLTVKDNHTVLVGENGGFLWAGQSLKTLSNSVYGVISFPSGRYYNWDVGDTVTTCCQAIIKKSYEKLQEWGCTVIGGDTDSTFVILNGQKAEDINQKFKAYYIELAKEWNVDKPYINFEHEKHVSPMLFVKKKNYAYKETNGEIVIKGLECIKADANPLAATLQKTFIKDVMHKKVNALEWEQKVEELNNRVFNQGMTSEELILSKAISKMPSEYEGYVIDKKTKEPKIKADGSLQKKAIPAHVKLAQRLIDKGASIYPGSKIHYIVIADKPILAITLKEFLKGSGNFTHKHKKLGEYLHEWEGEYATKYYWLRVIKPLIKVVLVYYDSLPDWNFGLTQTEMNKIKN